MAGDIILLDASRGSALWAFNQFRTDALTQLLNDLTALEQVGLKIDQCDRVKRTLAELTNIATAIPDGSYFRSAIWKEFEHFSDIYAQWNSHEGGDPAFIKRRQTELRRLRARRHKIANRIRRNQHILQNDLDLKMVSDMYRALGSLTKALPEIFLSLAKSVERFADRMP